MSSITSSRLHDSAATAHPAAAAGQVPRLALIKTADAIPPVFRELLLARWCRAQIVDAQLVQSDLLAGLFDAALVVQSPDQARPALERLLPPAADSAPWPSLIVLADAPVTDGSPDPAKTPAISLPADASIEHLRGAVVALHQARPVYAAHARQLAGMQRLHESLHHHFDAIDRELRLASRMQRDFLPPEKIEAGRLAFNSYFRPCTWVSGDIFDVFRLDEHRFGFYLADAVGHGVAAGLLTMYIKHAIKPRRIHADGCELVRPSEVLAALNDQLAAQGLPDSQFITGWYGLIDTRTLRLDYAVAGHPPPMIVDADGLQCELHGEGSLLGLYPGQKFSDESFMLQPGERLVLYSDGLEPTFIADRPPIPALPRLAPGIEDLLRAPFDVLRNSIVDSLETAPGSITNADDVTFVVLDIKE